MKYLQLTGICSKSIKNNLYSGCSKLELDSFTGQDKCKYVQEPIKQIKDILGIGEQIKI